MAYEYTSEQQIIRTRCYNWRQYTIQLVQEEKWDMIQKNPCSPEDCSVCHANNDSAPLDYLFLFPKTFNHDVQAVIERIYGPQSPDDWYRLLLDYKANLQTIRYFIQNRLIDINCGIHEYTLFSFFPRYHPYQTIELWDYLLSDEVQCDINIQDKTGENALLTYLRFTYYDGEDVYPEEREEEHFLNTNQHIAYLLQHGADPLLADKDGVSAYTYASNISTFTQDQKERLIRLLETAI